MQQRDLSAVRIFEIGTGSPFKDSFPGQVRSFNIWRDGVKAAGDPKSLYDLGRQLRAGDYDLIVCTPETRNPWHWQALGRQIFSKYAFQNMRRPLRVFGPQLLRFWRKAPVAVMDMSDAAFIDHDNFFMMDLSTIFFKRELPADEWQLLTKTASDTQPSVRIRTNARFRRRMEKLRPLPLGLPWGSELDLPERPPEKTVDVFFAGTWKGFGVRERALAEARTLRDEGYVIDIPDTPMPRREFYERCGRAWLTLSPEGHGWDCFRHYEAPASWSVPLMNYPSIRRHAPLVDGEHCFFYDPVPGGLASTIRRALANKGRLTAMAAAAREHVLAHHTQSAIRHYVVQSTLEAARNQR